MEFFLLIVMLFIPSIGLYSGLSVAITVPIFAAGCFWQTWRSIEFNYKNYKLELIFIVWILLSCAWSLSFEKSLVSAIKVIVEFLLGLLLIRNIDKIKISPRKFEKTIATAFAISLILFTLEYLSKGRISIIFREIFQEKESHIFILSNLDRGIALLTLLGWLIIGFLLKNHSSEEIIVFQSRYLKKNVLLASSVYLMLFLALIYSDNLAALVGHIVATFVFLVTRFTFLKNPKILSILLIIGSCGMILFSFQIDALKVSKTNELLPLSAKHRLFIWNFVAQSSKSQPILGIGFNSSRIFSVDDEQIIDFNDSKLHPLPLHPHNNIMQVYFELGIIGLIIYLIIMGKYLCLIGKNYKTINRFEKNWISSKYACFSAYFVIAMISYNIWQSWWIAALIWISSLFKFLDDPQ